MDAVLDRFSPAGRKHPAEILVAAYEHVCDPFPGLLTHRERQASIDAQTILIYARDAVLSEIEHTARLFRGDTFDQLLGLVERTEAGR